MTGASQRRWSRGAARALGLAGACLWSAGGCGSEPPGDDAGETDDTGVDVSELAPFEAGPLCGEAGARRILELPADAVVRAEEDGVVEIGERLYVAVAQSELFDDTTVQSVGPCGEAPALTGDLAGGVFSLPPWPEVPIGCAVRQFAILDPMGQVGPQPVLAGCRAVYVAAYPVSTGIVLEMTDETGDRRASLHPYAPGATPALDAGVELVGLAGSITTLDDEVLFIPPEGGDGTLTRISLPSLEAEALAADVVNFAATAEHLLYFVETEPYAVMAVLRERESGDEVVLEFGAAAWEQLDLGYKSYSIDLEARAAVLPQPYPKVGAWVVDLESGAQHLIDEDHELVRQVADGRWFARNALGAGVLLDLENDAEALVADDYGAWPSWVGGDALLQLKDAPQGLWRTAYDGSPPELLATRASEGFVLLRDGRVLTTIEVDAGGIGALVVVDSSTLEERLIDPAVGGFAWGQGGSKPVEPGVIAYQVVDGERSGVYRINLDGP